MRCTYITAYMEGGAEPVTAAFVEMCVALDGHIGFAPAGFFPNGGVGSCVIPVADGDPGHSPVTAVLGKVLFEHVVDITSSTPQDAPLVFNDAGGWPDLDVAVQMFADLDGGDATHSWVRKNTSDGSSSSAWRHRGRR